MASSTARAWRLNWRGRSWSLEDNVAGAQAVTGTQVLQVSVELGSDTWEAMDPARSPNALMTWLAVLAAESPEPEDLLKSYAEVGSATAAEVMRSLTFTETNGSG